MFTYSEEQRQRIDDLVQDGNFPAAYRLAADLAEGQEGVNPASVVWMRGAADVNENFGNCGDSN